ncbi:MAG: FAD-binding oxidoreductase [bacterium]|nr:FAD-binding oxidoreductase [bacterium]
MLLGQECPSHCSTDIPVRALCCRCDAKNGCAQGLDKTVQATKDMREGLYAIVGAAGIGEDTESYRIGDALPAAVVTPESEAEVRALMEYAHGGRFPCIVAGNGTHLTHLSPHERPWWLLSTRRLNRVVDYSPQDLVLTVGAGITLQEVQDVLREYNQYLPWNPALPTEATIGGIVSSNRSGSWRYRYGTPRDRLLALRAVLPDGVAFKSGAKVVKSVAGYDLHRLLCGAWGTLAVITEITLKVQPAPAQFEAVGWFTTWQDLPATLASLMRLPIQPDGISVAALRGGAFQGLSGLRAVSQVEWEWGEMTSRQTLTVVGATSEPLSRPRTLTVYGGVGVMDAPTLAQPRTLASPEPQPQPETDTSPPLPYVWMEFSGRPEGVPWQVQQLHAQGYPAEPIDATQLAHLRDWLAPRTHPLLMQIFLRPNEVGEAMARWTELQGVSAMAHAGSGVLYVAADASGLSELLIQRVRTLKSKYRVLNGADWLRAHSDGELHRSPLNAGELRLTHALKNALDERGILPLT